MSAFSTGPLHPDAQHLAEPEGGLERFPSPDRWDDWTELDAAAWPRRVERHYALIPTICFNCEAGCGLLAYVDIEKRRVHRFEGNPAHPGSRGRNCSKGPATLNQVDDPERIRFPMRRVGPRGGGKWERVSWNTVLDDLAGRIRAALTEGRHNEIMYHVGRPGHELLYNQRVLHAWGIDGHNSHTTVCSGGARAGYAYWQGYDRPSPDYAHARFILLLSAHLEAGHYFNPHAQRIMEAKQRGAKLCVMDTRLSNTAAKADYWLAPWPGSEAAVLLAMCRVLLEEDLYDGEFVRRWVNWEAYLRAEHPERPLEFGEFIAVLKRTYGRFTPEYAAAESGLDAEAIRAVAREVGQAGGAFATHIWRNAAAGNLGGWQVARALHLLTILAGAVGREGGVMPAAANKFIPAPPLMPPPPRVWNEMMWAPEYPLAFFEMSFLLPHFLREGRGKLAMYFTRAYNPVWTNPDGMSWIEALSDESKVGCHACLTPIWSETAQFADYVLPMGHASERHDLMSQETHAARWIGFRQPVLRVALERQGRYFDFTYEAHREAGLGEIWEEDEFWIELSWRIDPDGALGIRKHFESPYEPGRKMRIEEYYRWIFENSVPGLPQAAARENLTPLAYMRKYGAFLIANESYGVRDGAGAEGQGLPTPSGKLEFYSPTLKEWGWPEQAIPGYIESHVCRANIDRERGEMLLLPTFRLPTLVHSRSGNAKWLYEISHCNPLWLHPEDAERLGLHTGDCARVGSEIGYFVDRVWVTEAIRPGVVGCSHHLGRWRLHEDIGGERWSSAVVELRQPAPGQWLMRHKHGIRAFDSADADSKRIGEREAGVHQNLIFPVQPDPVSGQHCWHQKVTLTPAQTDDRYGDVFVNTDLAHAAYQRWLKLARPGPGPNGLRRPLWLPRVYRPAPEAFYVSSSHAGPAANP